MSDSERLLRARRSLSFGAQAAAYAEHRPDYPAEALHWGLAGSSFEPKEILDLAAGTGKLTQGLREFGLDVTAAEPDARMLAELSRRFPAVIAIQGRAERIPLPDASMDAVFVGQAFHWFEPEAAVAEIARVLRPGGVLVALWNHDDDSVPWVAELAKLQGTPASRKWAKGAEPIPESPSFEPFERARFHHAHPRTAETLTETIATQSHVLVAEPEERDTVLRKIWEFLAATPETSTGEFEMPIITTGIRARRR